ncbi:MAG: sigma-70 family RNA polymerase sigma factor [Coriobacteriia bacterium]|nr:sigma-70 family RNA polymerase sigma factor [Coriobacteriia bacterium]
MAERHIDRLVAKAIAGDARAFGRLYDEFADRVYAFVRGRVVSTQDAEDLTATVFLKAWEAINGYDDRGIPFGAWLFRIARNAVIDSYRRTARVPEIASAEDAFEVMDVSAIVDERVFARLEVEEVCEAMDSLTEEQRSVLMLRFVWGFDVKESAQGLGKSEGAVKALQHRAVRSLTRLLAEENEHG